MGSRDHADSAPPPAPHPIGIGDPAGPGPADGAAAGPSDPPALAKVLVAGAGGVGKSALLAVLSDTPPRLAEKYVSVTAPGHPAGPGATLNLAVGRIILEDAAVLLLSTPADARLWRRWEELLHGAIGAVVVVDAHRPADGRTAIHALTEHGIPCVIAVNGHGGQPVGARQIRARLRLGEGTDTVLVVLDVHDRAAALSVLVALLELAVARAGPQPPADPTTPEPLTSRN
ncbi:hypothetical protein AB0O82_13710 [Kitasatospora sp. NPDC088264]|uniref:hypothetical protein n=1 Tax=Kitasatospora sp. NPDC088264 TaxID=3155296 RepID=UPI003439D89D